MVKRVGSNGRDTLKGTGGNDFIDGRGGNDTLLGLAGKDTLLGGDGNDLLDGGAGADNLTGGRGGDTYIVDATKDRVVEKSGGGTDTIKSTISLTLPDQVERVVLMGSANLRATGNGLANRITGNGGRNTLDGAGGADTIDGGKGNDTLRGGTGDDTYVVDAAGDVVVEKAGQGIDTILSSKTRTMADHLERLVLTGSAKLNGTGNNQANDIEGNAGPNALSGKGGDDTLNGGKGDDSLEGGSGNDTLDGGSGADRMLGGTGDDLYRVNAAGDVVDETGGSGTDTVISAVSFTLPTDVERLELTGSGNVHGTGNGLDNRITGNAARNSLDGGAGADTLDGGSGNDTLIVDAVGDTVVGGAGTDTVRSTISFTLPDDVENLVLLSIGSTTGTGNALDNTVTGNTGNNSLVGGDGADTAAFHGALHEYVVTLGAPTTVAHATPSGIDDGTDSLTGFEIAAFNDLNLDIAGADPVAFLPLAELDGARGFRLNGAAGFDHAGQSVALGADADGDGLADTLVGAPQVGSNVGAVWSVFANQGGATSLDLADLGAGDGLRLDGTAANNLTGMAVAWAGDVDGDGLADAIVGAPYADAPGGADAGAAYVVFGTANAPASLGLAGLDQATGFRLDGVGAGDAAGFVVAGAGDVNGDGLDDVIVGAPSADHAGADAGAAYVVFGRADGFPAAIDLGALDGSDGFRLDGAGAGDLAGTAVAGGVDVDGDGFDDVIVGAPNADHGAGDAGAGYVVFGHAGLFDAVIDLGALDGSDGFRLEGDTEFGVAGSGVAGAGDVNGDGFGDLLIGAYGVGATGEGAAYLVFGHGGAFTATVDLGGLNGTTGVRLDGGAGETVGSALTGAGDVNADGFDDVLIGSPFADLGGTDSGGAYLVLGAAGGFGATLDLKKLDGTDGFRLDGAASFDQAGASVGGGGDADGDGFDDVILGAYRADPTGTDAGAAYFVFGFDVQGSATHLGTAGNDTLAGGAGNDVLVGGAGDDVLVFDVADVLRVDGGLGLDTLRVDGAGVGLNLSTVNATEHYNLFTGIEVIDLTGSGANTLTLAVADLLRLSDSSNMLRVDGGGDDAVDAGAGWTLDDAAGGYTTYSQGQATLVVADAIDRSGILT